MSITGNKSYSNNNIAGTSLSNQLNQILVNTTDIGILQQATTGITYNATGDLTTIDNNVTIPSTKVLKSAYGAQANEDVANKLYVDTKISNLVNSAPAILDTLSELASALNNDASFSTTVTNSIATKASLTANQTISGTNNFSNTSNTYYGSGANLSGVNSSTLTTSNMPTTGTFYPTFTNSAYGASGLVPCSINSISYDRDNNRLIVPYLNVLGYLKMTSTDAGTRAISNTFYNFMDKDGTAGGTQRGTIYADASYVYLTLNNGHRFMINIGGVNLFDINSTTLNCTVPLKMTHTDYNYRQIYNTIYNIMDVDTVAGGTIRGRLYGINPYVKLDLTAGNRFMIQINDLNVFDVDSTALSSTVPIKMLSTNYNNRQIYNTIYHIMDLDTTAGGVDRGRLYGNYPHVMFDLTSGHKFKIQINNLNVFDADESKCTFLNPPICSTNCSTSSQLANKAYVDIASSKITTSLLPTTGTYYLPFLTSSVAGSGLTAYSDGNISYDRSNNKLNVPNLYSYGATDFLNPPTCSTTATTNTQLVNKLYVDNASSNSPVGTIIMYGSNTIPVGWLLCNGSNVSKITYADLWNVIGDSFMFVPPPTGFFTLPNLVGQYPRGAGTNSTLSVSKITTLGQTIAGQVGKHAHVSAYMNSDTQGTTTTKTVVSSVTGAGLVTNTTSVCGPLVTTTATNGTTQSSIDAYKPYPTMLTDETFPNSVSVNYIIKFQTSATPVALPTPTFTQTTSVLTIQNNAPTSGIINFVLDDASSVAQTPLSLSSTAITVALPVTCSSVPTIGSHLVNKTYVDNLVAGGVSLTTTDQTITGVKTFASDLITSARVFGRNDGYTFDSISTTASSLNLYPIGYCFEIVGGTTLPVNLTDKTDNVSIALTKGVWILSGFVVINKGNGAYVVGTKLSVLWNVGIAGIKLFPNAAGAIVSIASTSTVTQHVISLGSVNVVVTTAGAIQTMTRNLAMTCGTTTSWSISFTGVKIA